MRSLATLTTAALLAGVLLPAPSARAEFIREMATGTFALVASDPTSMTFAFETSVVAEIGGLGIADIDGTAVQTFVAGDTDDFAGAATFIGAVPGDTLAVSFSGFITDIPGQSHASFAGGWEIIGGTGAYAGLVGDGNFSGSWFYTGADSGLVDMIWQGDVVPSPASMTLLALAGAVACLRRR